MYKNRIFASIMLLALIFTCVQKVEAEDDDDDEEEEEEHEHSDIPLSDLQPYIPSEVRDPVTDIRPSRDVEKFEFPLTPACRTITNVRRSRRLFRSP